ncbi:MAG: Rpn family recombination-promoting nuclease/putative transposase [Candidatus Ornithomonoglobus sp.]
MEIVKAKTDIVFKTMFTDKNNEDLLRALISALLGIPDEDIKQLVIENPEISPEEIDGKFTRLDLKLTVNDKLVNLELQLYNHGSFKERILYYWAHSYGNQLKKNESYTDIRETITIAIVNFNLFDIEDYHSEFTMADIKNNLILTDKCKIHFFELTKIGKQPDSENVQKTWLQLLNAESDGDLEMLAHTENPAIQKGVRVIRNYSEDARLRNLAYSREKAMHDEAQALEYAKKLGLAEGRAEGRAAGLAEGRAEGRAAGLAEGRAEGRAAGLAEGRAEGRAEGINAVIEAMKAAGMDTAQIEKLHIS